MATSFWPSRDLISEITYAVDGSGVHESGALRYREGTPRKRGDHDLANRVAFAAAWD